MQQTTENQPINPWNYKPWWCQPWSIILTGITIISGSWFALKIWWITALVAFPILVWWTFFLILWPRLVNLEMENGE
jgi:hypothetical protein